MIEIFTFKARLSHRKRDRVKRIQERDPSVKDLRILKGNHLTVSLGFHVRRLISRLVVAVFLSVVLVSLTSGCIEFPELPPIEQPQLELDMKYVEIIQDASSEVDAMPMVTQPEFMLPKDLTVEIDVMAPEDMMPLPDMEPIVDAFVEPENFTITQCINGVIEGSEIRVINGQEQTLTPLPCQDEGERWLRVNPVENVIFGATSALRQEEGLTHVTLNYTFFFMARETPYNQYAARCDATAFPDTSEERIRNATCRNPEVMSMLNDDCAHQAQALLNEGVMNGELSLPLEEYQLPMNCVSWEDAAQYCRRIGGRLPSEVEWEVAATYGRKIFPSPWPISQAFNQQLCQYINIRGNGSDQCNLIHPLQLSKIRPTCWGDHNPWREADPSYELCDTSANVAEWVLDDLSIEKPLEVISDGSPYLNATPHLCPDAVGGDAQKLTRGGNSEVYRRIDLDNVYLTAYGDGICNGVSAVTGFRCVMSDQTHGVEPWIPPSP